MKTFLVKTATRALFGLLLVLLPGCTMTTKVEPTQADVSKAQKICPLHLQKLCGAYDTIHRNYIKKLSDDEITEMFIRGFMKELREKQSDPYSKYTSTKDKKTEMVTDEKYAGLGMDIKKDTKPPYAIKVQRVFLGTPAYTAGITRGDQITSINGTPVADKTVEESRDLIRGKIDTRVTLTLSRSCEGPPFPVSIKRGDVEDTISGIAKIIAPHYAYVYIPSFETEKYIALRVKYSLAKVSEMYGKPQGLIVDLRNNPGGSVAHAQDFISLFVEKGDVLYDKAQNGREHPWSIPENSRDILSGAPIVILVNEDSKSSAEIVAGAMQDFGRATIVGTKTFGKGVMQTNFALKDGSSLHLTTAYTLTPNRTYIDKTGITPDIFVEEAPDESCTGDRQLAAGLYILKKKSAERTTVAQQ
jgi:carboxyl-terminal processing protease